MKFIILLAFIASFSFIGSAQNSHKTHPEYAGVERAMLNYVEALYEVDTNKIIASVHPSLRKIGYWYNPDKKEYMDNLNMSFDQLKSLTSRWNVNGNNADENTRKKVIIYDLNDRTASGKVEAAWGLDYIQLAKLNDKWMIMNIVWQSYPTESN
jgi:hypothetical protein